MATRALLTDCGSLLLQVGGVWSDGDLVILQEGEGETVIEDLETERPDLAKRAEIIREMIG